LALIGEQPTSHPGHFTLGKNVPGTYWIEGWVGLRVGLDDVGKNSCPYEDLNSALSVVHPVTSRYTDYAIPALAKHVGENILLSRLNRVDVSDGVIKSTNE
jgi:hypothetical protein